MRSTTFLRRALLALATTLVVETAAFAGGPDELALRPEWGLGPIDFRDEYVIAQTYLGLGAGSPATLPAGGWSVAVRGDWAQTIAVAEGPGTVLDVESVTVAPMVRHGLTDRIELSLELPLVYRDGGVLDPFIRDVESAIGSGVRRPRRTRPEHDFAMSGCTDEGRAFAFDHGAGVGKLRLGGEVRLLDGGAVMPALSLAVHVALPTASRGGFGTTGVDVGLSLALSKRFGDLVLYAGGSVLFPGGHLGPIALEPVQVSASAALEYEIRPWLAVIAQGSIHSEAVRDLGGRRGRNIYVGGGFKVTEGPFSFEIGALEDMGAMTRTADITFHVELGVRLR